MKLQDYEKAHIPGWLKTRMRQSGNLAFKRVGEFHNIAGFDWMDHYASLANDDGLRPWICEPYSISDRGLDQIYRLALLTNCRVTISAQSLYGNGTVQIRFEDRRVTGE